MVVRKPFSQILSINIAYPNMENMIAKPITKRKEIVMGIHVCLISWMNFNYKENGRKDAFLANPKHQYHVSNAENKIVVLIIKEMEIITRI